VEVIDYASAQSLTATHHRGELLSSNDLVGGFLSDVGAEVLDSPDNGGGSRFGLGAVLYVALIIVVVIIFVRLAGCRSRWYNPFTYGCG
jgi:hypothetical protein